MSVDSMYPITMTAMPPTISAKTSQARAIRV
jgi:hypothetical protein